MKTTTRAVPGPLEFETADKLLAACSREGVRHTVAELLARLASEQARADAAEAQLRDIGDLPESVWEDGTAASWIAKIRAGETGVPAQAAKEARYYGVTP